MKNKSTIIAAALSLTILASGCGGKSVKTGNENKSSEPTPIKMFIVDRADAPMSDSFPVFQKINEKCNVKLELEIAPNVNTAETFNILMASGDIPDVVVYKFDDLFRYTKAFEPIDELLEEYGQNIKKVIEEDETSKRDLKAVDGKMYILPKIAAVKTAQVHFARQDWLEKLNLKSPETLEEYYNMLKAFKTNDMNGNGQADEIPFTTRSKRSGLMAFTEAFGIKEEYFIDENDKVAYGAIDPRMKDVLAFLNKLYSEKLIDEEYLTIDNKQWQARVSNGQSGVLHDWVSRIDFFNNIIQKDNPNAKFAAILPPTQGNVERGTYYQMRRVRDDVGAAIAKGAKNKVEIMKMFNYIFSEEGVLLTNFGIEGEDYVMEGNEPKFTDSILNNPDGKSPQVALWSRGIAIDWPMKQDIRYEVQFLSAEGNAARDMYEPIIKAPFPKLKFTDEEREEISAKMADITTYKDEMLDKFIMGMEPIENFDSFVSKLKEMGIGEVLSIYNKAYERYKQ